jgi:hypothetical protein
VLATKCGNSLWNSLICSVIFIDLSTKESLYYKKQYMHYTNTAGYSSTVLSNVNSEIRKESTKWSQDKEIHKYFLFFGWRMKHSQLRNVLLQQQYRSHFKFTCQFNELLGVDTFLRAIAVVVVLHKLPRIVTTTIHRSLK